MRRRRPIPLDQVCIRFRIESETVREFADFGLYPVVQEDGESAIDAEYLDRLKRIVSLHRNLGINKEGIDIILELRDRITKLQDELELRNREIARLRRRVESEEPEALERRGLLIEIIG